MLKVITLYTIERIFNEDSEQKLSPMAKMVYISCLMHYFKDKPAKISSIAAFEILEEEMKSFEKHRKSFLELSRAGLVTIGKNSVIFKNLWGKHIDHSLLEKQSVESYLGAFNYKPVKDFEEELKASQSMAELARMKHRLSKIQLEKLIQLFIIEQTAKEKMYANYSDCISHFNNWIPSNINKLPQDKIKSNSELI